ncbi:hypothetical protein FRB96_009133 [Tulasnella sp. 330]|nr:hypothetical protein FRB96_009133 [Tulasnella sp. 330]
MRLGDIFASRSIKSALQLTLSLRLATPLYVSAQQTGTLPPWQNLTIQWEWSPGLSNGALTQCKSQKLDWWQHYKGPKWKPPFAFTFFREGFEPYVLSVGNGTRNTYGKALYYRWIVDLPTGGPYQAVLTDGQGASGGAAPVFTVEPAIGNSSCTLFPLADAGLDLTYTGATSECSHMNVSVTGGTPPYIFSVVEAANVPKNISFSTGYFEYILDVGYGNFVNFVVTDSGGRSVVGSQFQVTAGDSSCLTLASTLAPLSPTLTSVYQGLPSFETATTPTPTISAVTQPRKTVNSGAIVGGVLGALCLLLFALVGVLLWQRKQKRSARRRIDLFGPTELATEDTTGNSTLRPRAYSYQPLRLEDTAMAKIDLSELGGLAGGRRAYMNIQAAGHTRGSAEHESFPLLGVSPPYSSGTPSQLGTSSSNAAIDSHSSRATADSKREGLLAPRGFHHFAELEQAQEGDWEQVELQPQPQDQGGGVIASLLNPVTSRPPRILPLPPGAAAPNTRASLRMLGNSTPPPGYS